MVCLSVILFCYRIICYDLVIKDFVIKRGMILRWALYILPMVPTLGLPCVSIMLNLLARLENGIAN